MKAQVLRRVAEEQPKIHIEAITGEVQIRYLFGPSGSAKNADRAALASHVTATLKYAVNRILEDKLPKLAQCKSYRRRILLVWHGYWIAEPQQVKEAFDEHNLQQSQLDSVVLVLQSGEVNWIADPGKLFSL